MNPPHVDAGATDTQGTPPAERPRRLSDLPPSASAARLATHMLDPDVLKFIEAVRAAGLAPDLAGDELLRVATMVGDGGGTEKRLDALEAYYAANGDAQLSRTRRSVDRFFLLRATEPTTAGALVTHLAELVPEVGAIALERIGGGTDGPLVLRAGEIFAALLDDYEESMDTDEIDLRELEARRAAEHTTMVTLRGLVRAVNVLLDRKGVRERLVALRGDDVREAYIATSVTEAIELARGGYLDDDDVEDVMELAGW